MEAVWQKSSLGSSAELPKVLHLVLRLELKLIFRKSFNYVLYAAVRTTAFQPQWSISSLQWKQSSDPISCFSLLLRQYNVHTQQQSFFWLQSVQFSRLVYPKQLLQTVFYDSQLCTDGKGKKPGNDQSGLLAGMLQTNQGQRSAI